MDAVLRNRASERVVHSRRHVIHCDMKSKASTSGSPLVSPQGPWNSGRKVDGDFYETDLGDGEIETGTVGDSTLCVEDNWERLWLVK